MRRMTTDDAITLADALTTRQRAEERLLAARRSMPGNPDQRRAQAELQEAGDGYLLAVSAVGNAILDVRVGG